MVTQSFHRNRLVVTGAMLCLLSVAAIAADPPIFANKHGAIRGADPVAYYALLPGSKAVMGNDEFSYEWLGATWKFSNAENRDLFIADPEKYAPEYGGYCAFAVSHNFTKSIKPNEWEIVDGKLYLNYNRTAHKKWARDKGESITRADEYWPTVLKSCEKHNNCG
jgi:YHS domain-containing protein